MKKKTNPKTLFISAVISIIILFFGMFSGESGTINCYDSMAKLLFPLSRLLFFICLGLALGQVLETTGWTEKIALLARPFFRLSNLGHRCSAAFTCAFLSGTISNAMLLEFYQDKKISKQQLFLTNYVNQFPAFFLHLPTTFFIVIPLTGFAGVLYFSLTFAATLLRTICFFIFGYFFLSMPVAKKSNSQCQSKNPEHSKKKQGIWSNIKSKLPGRVMGIAVYVLPIYTLVFVLNAHGFFGYLNQLLSSHLTLEFMPVESLSVVILSFAAEFTSGFAAAGALMDAGVLTTKQTVIALLLGNVTAFPIRALRHQIPRYMGIFSPKIGLQLLLSGQMFRVSSIILVGFIYYMVG